MENLRETCERIYKACKWDKGTFWTEKDEAGVFPFYF